MPLLWRARGEWHFSGAFGGSPAGPGGCRRLAVIPGPGSAGAEGICGRGCAAGTPGSYRRVRGRKHQHGSGQQPGAYDQQRARLRQRVRAVIAKMTAASSASVKRAGGICRARIG